LILIFIINLMNIGTIKVILHSVYIYSLQICCYTIKYFMQSVVNFRHFIIL